MSKRRTHKRQGQIPAHVIRSITRDPDINPVSLYMAGFPAHTFGRIIRRHTSHRLPVFTVTFVMRVFCIYGDEFAQASDLFPF